MRLRAEDIFETLAWLDYCVYRGVAKKFRSTVSAHLSETLLKDFTWESIDNSIKSLWKHYPNLLSLSPNASSDDHAYVYRHGTKALTWVDEHETRRNEVRSRLKRLKSSKVPISASPSKAKRRSATTVEIPSSRKAKLTPDKRGRSGETTPRPRYQNHSTKRKRAVTPTIESSDRCSTGSPPPTLSTHFFTRVQGSSQPSSNILEHDKETSPVEPSSFSNSNELIIMREQLVDCQRELQYLRAELSKSQDLIQDLERDRKCERNAKDELAKRGDTSAEELLKSSIKELEIQLSTVSRMRAIYSFTTNRGDRVIQFDWKYFQKQMENIKCVIEQFMSSSDTSMSFDIHASSVGDDVQNLVRRVMESPEAGFSDMSFHSLLQSLLAAAVCDWVLETDFRENYLSTSPLRDAMLSHLAIQDGDIVAHNLDLAAHFTLIEGEYFQNHVIPSRAEALVTRFSRAIVSLFLAQKPADEWDINLHRELRKRQKSLKSMFVSSLKIKTRTFTTDRIFKAILPTPGSSYDSITMKLDIGQVKNHRSQSGNTPRVLICVCPGLEAYKSDRRGVDYNSFCVPGSEPTTAPDIIERAIVVPYE